MRNHAYADFSLYIAENMVEPTIGPNSEDSEITTVVWAGDASMNNFRLVFFNHEAVRAFATQLSGYVEALPILSAPIDPADPAWLATVADEVAS